MAISQRRIDSLRQESMARANAARQRLIASAAEKTGHLKRQNCVSRLRSIKPLCEEPVTYKGEVREFLEKCCDRETGAAFRHNGKEYEKLTFKGSLAYFLAKRGGWVFRKEILKRPEVREMLQENGWSGLTWRMQKFRLRQLIKKEIESDPLPYLLDGSIKGNAPNGYFDDRKKCAVWTTELARYLHLKLDMRSRLCMLRKNDYYGNGLGAMFKKMFHDVPHEAAQYVDPTIMPWEMANTTKGALYRKREDGEGVEFEVDWENLVGLRRFLCENNINLSESERKALKFYNEGMPGKAFPFVNHSWEEMGKVIEKSQRFSKKFLQKYASSFFKRVCNDSPRRAEIFFEEAEKRMREL